MLIRPFQSKPAVIELVDAGRADLYFVTDLPPPAGDCRVLEWVGYRPKDAGHENAVRRYQCLVRRPAGAGPQGECTCQAGTYRGHVAACRHLSAAHALWASGAL